MSGHGPIPTEVRLAVDARERRLCLRCAARGREIHHRVRRRDGGHPLSSTILLCRTCHRWAHANPTEAKMYGFIVPPWRDALVRPVKSYRGWMYLDDEGNYTFTDAPDETEAEPL